MFGPTRNTRDPTWTTNNRGRTKIQQKKTYQKAKVPQKICLWAPWEFAQRKF
jgi:hypothetical protein